MSKSKNFSLNKELKAYQKMMFDKFDKEQRAEIERKHPTRICGDCKHFNGVNTCWVPYPIKGKEGAYDYHYAQANWKCSNNKFEAK